MLSQKSSMLSLRFTSMHIDLKCFLSFVFPSPASFCGFYSRSWNTLPYAKFHQLPAVVVIPIKTNKTVRWHTFYAFHTIPRAAPHNFVTNKCMRMRHITDAFRLYGYVTHTRSAYMCVDQFMLSMSFSGNLSLAHSRMLYRRPRPHSFIQRIFGFWRKPTTISMLDQIDLVLLDPKSVLIYDESEIQMYLM